VRWPTQLVRSLTASVMLSRTVSPELRLALDQSTVILCPPRDPDEPTEDAVLSGTVELDLPCARSVPMLRVSLVGRSSTCLDDCASKSQRGLR